MPRVDFGFTNPNTAGAFFALLALAVFLLPPGKDARGWWRWLASAVFVGCMLLTASRGAVFGLAAGGFSAWAAYGFPRARPAWFLGGALVFVLLSLVFGTRTLERISSISPLEGSTASRLTIYRSVPAMIVAAPGGWGPEKAAIAYENWFQSPDSHVGFKNLLSTHATWVVERGIGFFLAYLLLWAFALLVCSPPALGVVVAWGVCCSFSHVGAEWWMWILPVGAVGISLWGRYRRREWPGRGTFLAASLTCGTVVLCTLLVGYATAPHPRIHYTGRALLIGSGPPELWFLSPDPAVVGKTYGKVLRGMGNLAVADEWQALQPTSLLVLCGSVPDPELPPSTEAVSWLNPPARLSPSLENFLRDAPKKTIFWGDLRQDASSRDLRAWFSSLPKASWVIVPGKGEFLGDGLAFLTRL